MCKIDELFAIFWSLVLDLYKLINLTVYKFPVEILLSLYMCFNLMQFNVMYSQIHCIGGDVLLANFHGHTLQKRRAICWRGRWKFIPRDLTRPLNSALATWLSSPKEWAALGMYQKLWTSIISLSRNELNVLMKCLKRQRMWNHLGFKATPIY